MSYGAVTVPTSATLILSANNERKSMLIYNNGTVNVFVGPDASVTTSTGMPLIPNSSLGTSGRVENWRGSLYAIAESATADVRYWDWNA